MIAELAKLVRMSEVLAFCLDDHGGGGRLTIGLTPSGDFEVTSGELRHVHASLHSALLDMKAHLAALLEEQRDSAQELARRIGQAVASGDDDERAGGS